jgi:DeoR family transcriptional regulator, aga operon transcriptional repressor
MDITGEDVRPANPISFARGTLRELLKRGGVVLASNRRTRILERVAEEQTIRIGELAQEFGVSEMTIRRDIARLEHTGFLRRTYGGATAHQTRTLDPAFNVRSLQNAAAKRLIAMRAVALLGDVATIFMGTGTTTEQFARLMPTRDDLTVVCESLPVAGLLGTRKARVVVLGGLVHEDELSCVGPIASSTVRRYHADVAVLGAAGLTVRHGITELFEEEAENHRLMIERSERLLLLADGTKFDHDAMAQVASVTAIATLVTDESAPAAAITELRAAGVEVIVAQRPSTALSTDREQSEAIASGDGHVSDHG